MRILTAVCVLVTLSSLPACGDSQLADAEASGALTQELHSAAGSGAQAPGHHHRCKVGDFVGSWRELASAPGYTAFMVLDASGQGYLCNEDGKSQAEFPLTIENGHAVMGDYGYGTGDELSLWGRNNIVRTGIDHGETYTVHYRRVQGVPSWCTAQIEEMKQN